MAKKGWEGAVLKLYRAKDYTFTVLGSEPVTDHFQRVRVSGGGLLAHHELHPTMWVRLWFDHPEGKAHQRAFTLVDADVEADEFTLEFAIHDGVASRWALAAQPGDTIEASLQGSALTLPSPAPAAYVIAGDTASLPAINSLLDAIGDVDAHVYLEWVHESDRTLPLRSRSRDQVTWVQRERSGEALVEAVAKAPGEIGVDASSLYGWAACDAASTRALTKVFKETYGLPKTSIKTLGYWQP